MKARASALSFISEEELSGEAVRGVRLIVILCAAFGCHAGAAQAPSSGADVPYRVDCASSPAASCRADLATYVGWRVFQAQCAACHAADARGSSFAPDLTERMRAMPQRDFFSALDSGYLGSRSTMPPRGRDPNVAPYYDELWSYLLARRDGVLPPGSVERLLEPEAGVAADPR
jgi:mono/diheme cytochrome c family protein